MTLHPPNPSLDVLTERIAVIVTMARITSLRRCGSPDTNRGSKCGGSGWPLGPMVGSGGGAKPRYSAMRSQKKNTAPEACGEMQGYRGMSSVRACTCDGGLMRA